ncbi:MAG: permease [Gammaproteobacteria bacterium]
MAISVNADGTAACCGPDVIVDEASCGTTSCCDGKPEPSGINRLWSYLTTVWALIALIPLTVLVLDPDNIGQVLSIGASAFGGTLPYIVIAVLMIGYLKATGAENIVARAFEGREYRMIVFAALFGGLAPFCSCEVIPFVAGLLAVGAPLSAVMAFWLSSPLIDPPSLMITAAALGWDFAIGKAVAAVALGLFGGFGVKLLLLSGPFSSPLKAERAPACSSGTCGVDEPFAKQAVWKFWKEPERVSTFRDESLSNAVFLIKWLMLAYLIEALLILYVPASVIGTAVGGDGFWPIVMGALVGMPAYLNSYAAPPLIAGLMEQGMSAGSAMAFMVAGAISSIPAMAAVWSLVKKPVFAAYLGFGVSGAVLFGALFAALMA